MNRSRPAYIERKIALERQRREALRSHEQPCICGFCLTVEEIARRAAAALERNPGHGQEVPF